MAATILDLILSRLGSALRLKAVVNVSLYKEGLIGSYRPKADLTTTARGGQPHSCDWPYSLSPVTAPAPLRDFSLAATSTFFAYWAS